MFERQLRDYRSSKPVPLDRASEALLVDALRAWPAELVAAEILDAVRAT